MRRLNGIINTQDDVAAVITGTDSPWPTLTTSGERLTVENEATIADNGYANIENAANALVADITAAQNAGGSELSGQDEFVNSDPNEYVLSPATHTTDWNFNNDFSMTTSKGFATGNCYGISGIKYSTNVQYTINIPAGIEITGTRPYGDKDASFRA